jgi:hypothetical protein
MKNILLFTSLVIVLSLTGCSSPNKAPFVKINAPGDNAKLAAQEILFQGEWSDSDGTIEKIEWNFGDGETSTEKSPHHRYAKSGTHTVTLRVSDNKQATSTTQITLTILAPPQAAAFVRAITDTSEIPLKFISGKFPVIVELDATRSLSDTQIKSFHWELGDGKTSKEAKLLYKYEIPGDYEVQLTITDENGIVAKDAVAVRVLAPENSSFTVSDFTYYLDKQNQLNSLDQSNLKTFSYRYIIDPESLRAHPRFTPDQVRVILMDAIQRAAAAPRVGKATIWLFAEYKNNFMAPSNYDHYLGLADWESPAATETAQILLNKNYFDGSAPSVYGYLLLPEPVENDRAEFAQVYLKGETFCAKQVIYTLEELMRMMASKDAFLVDIFGSDKANFLGSFAAVRNDLTFDRASLGRLKTHPNGAEKILNAWRIQFALPNVPNC